MKTFSYVDLGGSTVIVRAHRVSFEPSGHVAFWQRGGRYENDRLVKAVESADQVTEVGEATEAARG